MGHDKEAWFSRFLVWMTTNHGGMSGIRYKEGKECCGGKMEEREHFLLRCGKWWEERWRVWKVYYGEEWVGEGWIDLREMLFGEREVRKLKESAEVIGWKEMVWKVGGWKGEELRKGREVVERLRGCEGFRIERSKEEIEVLRKWNRERVRKKRGLLTQVTTANATVVTGATRLSKRMMEDGWKKVEGRGIVKEGKDKEREENRRVLGMIHRNRGREGFNGRVSRKG